MPLAHIYEYVVWIRVDHDLLNEFVAAFLLFLSQEFHTFVVLHKSCR